MCGATPGGAGVQGVDLSLQAIVEGTVTRGDSPVAGAYVRLLDATGEFTAEVQTSEAGTFRFFAAPGDWTLRTLVPGASVDTAVSAVRGSAAQALIAV